MTDSSVSFSAYIAYDIWERQMKLDPTSIEIIKHLRQGRKSFKIIAQALSISENTVRSRVKRLTDEGVLEIAGLVDPEAVPGT